MGKKKGPTVMVKKKRWVTIIAPKVFNEKEIGETYVTDPNASIGRKCSVSMMTITGDPSKQNVNAKFLIKGFVGDRLTTELIGWSLTSAATKKMMRRNRSKVEVSFIAKTADDIKMRIKPVLITRGKASGGVMTALRKELQAKVEKALAKIKFEQFVKEIVMKKFQRSTADGLRKIHPVAFVEIKKFDIIEDKK